MFYMCHSALSHVNFSAMCKLQLDGSWLRGSVPLARYESSQNFLTQLPHRSQLRCSRERECGGWWHAGCACMPPASTLPLSRSAEGAEASGAKTVRDDSLPISKNGRETCTRGLFRKLS